jgi:hypothetical protein
MYLHQLNTEIAKLSHSIDKLKYSGKIKYFKMYSENSNVILSILVTLFLKLQESKLFQNNKT